MPIFEIAKNTIAKKFNGYIVFIVVMNFRKNFSAQNNSSLQYLDFLLKEQLWERYGVRRGGGGGKPQQDEGQGR